MSRSTYVAIGASALAGLFLVACSSSTSLTADQVSEEIRQQLAIQFDENLDDVPAVDCPGSLEGQVGTTMTCTLDDGGDLYDVYVEVTSVEGSKVNFSADVADEPN